MDPLIALGAANLAGQGINAISQIGVNKKTRQWNEKMYNIQRQHALEDWTRQNEYNSPQQQMQRLKMAGLNPNLVYGRGADNTAAPVRSSDFKSWQPDAPRVDLGGAVGGVLSAYYDFQVKEAQVDNLKAQNTVAINEAALKAAQTANVLQNTKTGEFDLGLKSELRQTSLEAAKAQLDQLRANTRSTLDANERAAAMQAPNLQKAAEEILNMRANRSLTQDQRRLIDAQIDNIKKDGRLKELDIQLKELGIQPSDPIYLRVLAQAVDMPAMVKKIAGWFTDEKPNLNSRGWLQKILPW